MYLWDLLGSVWRCRLDGAAFGLAVEPRVRGGVRGIMVLRTPIVMSYVAFGDPGIVLRQGGPYVAILAQALDPQDPCACCKTIRM